MENDNQIQAEEADYLYLQNSQITNAGKGLFTAITIYKEEIIAYFKGEVLSFEDSETRAKTSSNSYFMNLPNGKILDCNTTTGFAKYANDATEIGISNNKNNAEIALDENQNVCLIAKRTIKSGEEIFCSYGKKYWKKRLK